MSFPGPVIETLGMRRSGLWAGCLAGGGMGGVCLLMLLPLLAAKDRGCGTWALGAFTALLFWVAWSSFKELAWPRPLLRVTAQGLAFRIKAGRAYWEVPWSQVREVRHGVETGESAQAYVEFEIRPDASNPMPAVRMNAGGGPDGTLRLMKGALAGDPALTADRLEAYRRSFTEGR
ncbi:MAG: hypothetical protein U0P81_07260 [Holophagaceae bacterium]